MKARLVVVALVAWAVAEVLRAILAVGYYEHRIVVVTHGDPDVWPAWMAYELLDELMPSGVAASVVDGMSAFGGVNGLYGVLVAHGGALEATAFDTRTVAYPLWTAGAVAVVTTALLAVRVLHSHPRRRNIR